MDQSNKVPGKDANRTYPIAPTRNIVDTAIAAGNFTIFAAATQAAGLSDVLAAKGPYTVFAPTDDAFRRLPPGAYDALLRDTAKLKAILNYHIVPGHFMSDRVKSGEVMTLQGSTLTAAGSSSDLRVNGGRVKQADLVATNGVVHGIDAVILPKSWQLLAVAA